jgi:hypothetical protein
MHPTRTRRTSAWERRLRDACTHELVEELDICQRVLLRKWRALGLRQRQASRKNPPPPMVQMAMRMRSDGYDWATVRRACGYAGTVQSLKSLVSRHRCRLRREGIDVA